MKKQFFFPQLKIVFKIFFVASYTTYSPVFLWDIYDQESYYNSFATPWLKNQPFRAIFEKKTGL